MDVLSSLAIVLCGAAVGAAVGYAGWRALTRQGVKNIGRLHHGAAE
jgi:hypothetical protein